MSRRLRRRLIVAGALLVAVVAGGTLAARLALNSGYARNLVAAKLSAATGLPVEVDHLRVAATRRQSASGSATS